MSWCSQPSFFPSSVEFQIPILAAVCLTQLLPLDDSFPKNQYSFKYWTCCSQILISLVAYHHEQSGFELWIAAGCSPEYDCPSSAIFQRTSSYNLHSVATCANIPLELQRPHPTVPKALTFSGKEQTGLQYTQGAHEKENGFCTGRFQRSSLEAFHPTPCIY